MEPPVLESAGPKGSTRHTVGASHEFRGLRSTEHRFTVPLDHSAAGGGTSGSAASGSQEAESITVFAREYVSTAHSAEAAAELPWLLFLQGGPGGRGNRLTSLGGWSKAAAQDFRILMLDQRGTGLSAPIDRSTLAQRGDAAAQARYLEHFRADSIVADAELIRGALGSPAWSIFGQSYGGFCAPDVSVLCSGRTPRGPHHRWPGAVVSACGRRLPRHLSAGGNA